MGLHCLRGQRQSDGTPLPLSTVKCMRCGQTDRNPGRLPVAHCLCLTYFCHCHHSFIPPPCPSSLPVFLIYFLLPFTLVGLIYSSCWPGAYDPSASGFYTGITCMCHMFRREYFLNCVLRSGLMKGGEMG